MKYNKIIRHDSVVFPFDACSRLSLRSCCLLCLIPPLAPAPAHAPAACSAHSRRLYSFRSLPRLNPYSPTARSTPHQPLAPYGETNGATFSLPPTYSPALTRTDHSLMRADDMQACNCWVEEIRIAAASADKLLLSADKLLLSHVSLRRL